MPVPKPYNNARIYEKRNESRCSHEFFKTKIRSILTENNASLRSNRIKKNAGRKRDSSNSRLLKYRKNKKRLKKRKEKNFKRPKARSG